MRNLKRALSLALASVMLLGMMVVGTGASYADVSSEDNKEAIEFLQSLSVMSGDDNGNFNPDQVVTRAEMTVIICKMLYGDKLNVAPFVGADTFNDVPAWAQGFVNLCASQGIVGGVGDNKFAPNEPVTTAQAALMLARALGYFQTDAEFAQGWMLAATERGTKIGLYENLGNLSATAGLTRNDVAQMAYNAMTIATPVQYNKLIEDYSTVGTSGLSGNVVRGDTPGNFQYTLAGTVFSMKKAEGYVTGATYNESTKKYTYTVKSAITGGTNVVVVSTTQDLNASIGLKVEALYKPNTDGTNTAYGLNSKGIEVVSTVGELEIGTRGDDKVKVDGVEYKLSANDISVPVYTFASGSVGSVGTLDGITANQASKLTLVDSDKNGKYDYAVVAPVTVSQVTYAGKTSISAGSTYKYEDSHIYDGAAKDDFVMITAAANTVDGKAVVTKLTAIQGKVNALKNTTDVQIDGTWYKRSANIVGDTASVGDTVSAIVVGDYYYSIEIVNGKSMDNVLMVLKAGAYSEGLAVGAEAQVMYAKDGTTATVKVSKVDVGNGAGMKDVTAVDSYITQGAIIPGGMYTYTEKNGTLELTVLKDNVISDYVFKGNAAVYDDDKLYNTTTPAITVGGSDYPIADNAIVMAYSAKAGSEKSAYLTGAQLKSWKTTPNTWGTFGQVLVDEINGVNTIVAATLYDNAKAIPGSTGTDGFGYIVKDGGAYFTTIDGTDYAVVDLWTADGLQKGVKVESINAGTTPTKANVSGFPEGIFVKYDKLANGNIGNLTAIAPSYMKAIEGISKNSDGEQVLITNGGAGMDAITSKTVIIYIDSSEMAGATEGVIAVAQKDENGKFIANVVSYEPDGDREINVLFVDVNNDINGSSVEITSNSVAAVNTALASSNKVIVNSALTVNSKITVGAGQTLTINGAVTTSVADAFDVANGGKVVINNDLTISSNNIKLVAGAKLTVTGKVTTTSAGIADITNASTDTFSAGEIDASAWTADAAGITTLFTYTDKVTVATLPATTMNSTVGADQTLTVKSAQAAATTLAASVEGTVVLKAVATQDITLNAKSVIVVDVAAFNATKLVGAEGAKLTFKSAVPGTVGTDAGGANGVFVHFNGTDYTPDIPANNVKTNVQYTYKLDANINGGNTLTDSGAWLATVTA